MDSEVDIDCGPVTQIIHFDESRPNEIIHNARWESGANFNMDINISSITCSPTMSPTTAIPSSFPTISPSTGTNNNMFILCIYDFTFIYP